MANTGEPLEIELMETGERSPEVTVNTALLALNTYLAALVVSGLSESEVNALIDAKIAELVDSSPSTLNTLNELAAALGDDPNFATTVATSIGTKLAKSANLSDLTSVSTARTNLGLGDSAVRNVGSGSGDVAPGNQTKTASQISDSTTAGRALLTAVDAAAQRTALSLGSSAIQMDAVERLRLGYECLMWVTEGPGTPNSFLDGSGTIGMSDPIGTLGGAVKMDTNSTAAAGAFAVAMGTTHSVAGVAKHKPSMFTAMEFNTFWYVPTLSDVTNTFLCYAGFIGTRSNASTTPTNGAFFRLSGSTLQCVTVASGVETSTNWGTTFVAATKYILRVRYTPTQLEFYVNQNTTPIATHTTNIMANTTIFDASTGIIKSAGTTNRSLYSAHTSFWGVYA